MDVIIVEILRIALAHADLDPRREMQGRDGAILRQNRFQPLHIADIAALERPPFHVMFVARRKIVIDDRGEARLTQRLGRMRADIARPADHKNMV